MLTLMLWSSIRLFINSNEVTLWGIVPDYLGILPWMLFITLGLLFMRSAHRLLLSRPTLYILSLALIVSLFYNSFYVRHGFREAGVMFQPTTMAMYGLFGSVLCLHQLERSPRWKWQILNLLLLILSVSTVMLCQSRVAYILLLIILSAWAVKQSRKHLGLAVQIAVLIICLAVIPQVASNYFSRFSSHSVDRGISYRLDIYKTAGTDVARHNYLIGNGPATLPLAINNQNAVPPEIAKSLNLGFRFLSTHDLYFDFAYYFGCLAALLLLGLTTLALLHLYKMGGPESLALLALLVVMIGNALANVPSIELTSMYFIVLFGSLGLPPFKVPIKSSK